jgi:hypothetical protein
MGIAGVVWLLAEHGFSATGAVIVAAGSAWKLSIGALQMQSLPAVRRLTAR